MRRVAIVTGGASGLGQAIGQRLSHQGHPVGVLDVDGDAAERQAASLRASGGEAIAVAADVADRDSDRRCIRTRPHLVGSDLDPGHQRCSLGVRCLRGSHRRALGPVPRYQPHRDVRLRASGHRRHGGSPVGSDRHDLILGRADRLDASGALFGIERRRHRSDQDCCAGIRLGSVSPPIPFPPSVSTRRCCAPHRTPPSYRARMLLAKAIPVGRDRHDRGVAAMCGFLCSEEASYVTAQVIGVNGGAVR